jgi:nitrogen fixation protein FixH
MAAVATKPLTGRTVLLWLAAFFAVVIGVNIVMIKLAVDTLSGTEVDSAYKASLAYNAEIRAARDQAGRGWSVAAAVARDPTGAAAIKVDARGADNVPLTGLIFSARLSRPTDKRADRPVTLSEREAGIYRGQAGDVAPGQWDLVLEADRGAERLFLSRNRVVLE